jgi:hypothetical protein
MEMEEIPMADNDFNSRAVQTAINDVEQQLIQANRDFEDAERSQDELLAADAMKRYAQHKRDLDELTGATEQQRQQQSGQLSAAQKSFLSRRQHGGDDLTTPQRWADYARAHDKAVAAGLQPDSDAYFRSIEFYVDHQGDGRIAPLTQTEAAQLCGVTDEEYAQQAQKLARLKREGHYQD